MKRNLLIASSFVLMFTVSNAQTVSSFAGIVNTDYVNNYSNNSPALADAYFYQPEGLAWDQNGNMYVTESNKIRLITAGKVYNRSGKLGDPSFSLGYANGTSTAAHYYSPTGAVCDAAGNVFIVDGENHAIRKLTAFVNIGNGQIASTLAGAAPSGGFGTSGYKDGAGSVARFDTPKGVTIDGNGNLYVTDFLNHCIRKISPTGSVITLAGTGTEFGNKDGVGSAARFDGPYGIAMLDATNLVVTDFANAAIRKINISSGAVTTICPGGLGFADGSLATAKFRAVRGVAVVDGLIYVADNSAIRVIDIANNTVSTFAGSGSSSGNMDGVGTAARFGLIQGLGYDGGNALFVTDVTNHIIKKITIDNLAPVADFSTSKENIQINEETTMTDISGGKAATIRKWLVEKTTGGSSNVVLVQGDYNASKSITVKFTATGSYRVTMTVTNEYGTDQVVKTHITVSTVGVAEVTKDGGVTIFPNPVIGQFINLQLNSGSFENTVVRLSDLSGAVVSEEVVASGLNHRLNVADLSRGMYYLVLQDRSGIVSKRIVIQ